VVAGGQGALDGYVYEPVEPDDRVEGEEPLDGPGPQARGFARQNPVTAPSQMQMIRSFAPQYQREWPVQYP
jgi:hypothetical protein